MAGPELPRVGAQTFSGIIERAAAEHLPTADLWAAIRANTPAGTRFASDILTQVNTLRGQASARAFAADRLAAAGPDTIITSRLIAPAPYARPLAAQALAPGFDIRFSMRTVTAGIESVDWYRLRYPGSIEGVSVGDLQSIVGDYAESLAGSSDAYGSALVSVDAIQLWSF